MLWMYVAADAQISGGTAAYLQKCTALYRSLLPLNRKATVSFRNFMRNNLANTVDVLKATATVLFRTASGM